MRIGLVDKNNIVCNIIVMEYLPINPTFDSYLLVELNEWVGIGDKADAEKPKSWVVNEKIAEINRQFKADKSTLSEYYTQFLMAGDTESAQEIVAELTALQEKYDKDIAEAEKEAEE